MTPEDYADTADAIEREVGKVIVGQAALVRAVVICLLCEGHALLEGVPGLGKTVLLKTLSEAVDLEFSRIQFTPDLMPADIVGTQVLEQRPDGSRDFAFRPGPVFASLVLADEINRATPKTQSALLEAMQEHSVTVGGTIHRLKEPFFVMATQNPIEQEGTYPLPEAQLDRFMFELEIRYPERAEEIEIVRATTAGPEVRVEPVVSRAEVLEFQDLVRRAPVPEAVVAYAVDLARRSRPDHPQAPEAVRRYVGWGAGPRAGQFLTLGAKARALLQGRAAPDLVDVRTLADAVLRHRVVLNYEAEAARVGVGEVIDELVRAVDRDAG